MTTRRLYLAIVAAITVAATLSSFACDDDDSGGDATSTSAATEAPAITSAEPGAIDIRTVDLEATRAVQDMLRRTNGEFSVEDVIYADINADGADDAIVPVLSGGTMGATAFVAFVASPRGAEPVIEQMRGVSISLEVVDGQLVETMPVPGPDDPECCPSQLRSITYLWDGTNFIIERDETAPNPDAGVKTSTP